MATVDGVSGSGIPVEWITQDEGSTQAGGSLGPNSFAVDQQPTNNTPPSDQIASAPADAGTASNGVEEIKVNVDNLPAYNFSEDPQASTGGSITVGGPVPGDGFPNENGVQVSESGVQVSNASASGVNANAATQAELTTLASESAAAGKGLSLAAAGNSNVNGAVNALNQAASTLNAGAALANGSPAAMDSAAEGLDSAFKTNVIATGLDGALLLTGTKSLTNLNDVLNIAKDVGTSLGGKDGQNVAETATAALSLQNTLGANLGTAAGQKSALGAVGAVADLFDDSKLAQGASVASQAVTAFNAPTAPNLLNLGAGALSLLGADSGLTNTVSTIAGAITNPVGTALGLFVGGLNDALTWKPNESTLSDVYGAVQGNNGTVNAVRAGETDAQDGKFGLKISQLNSKTLTAAELGPSVLKEGEYITNASGDARATLSDSGLLQLQKANNGAWQTTYQAGIAVNAKNDTVLYVDQGDGKSKIAVAGKAADGSTVYTPIWQSDGSAGAANGQTLALNVGNNGVLQVGSSSKANLDEYNRQYNAGFLGIGGSYNRAENGQAIAQSGTTEFATKGDYGNFDNANQAPKIQTVDAKLGIYDVQFKDQQGVSKELVREQRNAADLTKNSSLSFLEVQDTNYTPVAEGFSSAKVLTKEEAAGGIFAGKLRDVTGAVSYQPELNANGMNATEAATYGGDTTAFGRGVVSAIDGKEYHVYVDDANPGAIVKVETSQNLEKQAYQGLDISKLQTRTYDGGWSEPTQNDMNAAIKADLDSGKIREITDSVSGSLVTKVGGDSRGTGARYVDTRVFQAQDGTFFKTSSAPHIMSSD